MDSGGAFVHGMGPVRPHARLEERATHALCDGKLLVALLVSSSEANRRGAWMELFKVNDETRQHFFRRLGHDENGNGLRERLFVMSAVVAAVGAATLFVIQVAGVGREPLPLAQAAMNASLVFVLAFVLGAAFRGWRRQR